MTREQRLKRLAAFLRDFAALLEEIPVNSMEAVRERFCDAMGAYLKAMERGTDERIQRADNG